MDPAPPEPPPTNPAPERQLLHERWYDWFKRKSRTTRWAGVISTVCAVSVALVTLFNKAGETKENFHKLFGSDSPSAPGGASGQELVKTTQAAAQGALLKIMNDHLGGAPPAAQIDVVYQAGSSGEVRQLGNGEPLSSADGYRVRFRPLETACFYVLQIDGRGHLDWLFPRNATNPASVGANPVAAGETITLPTEDSNFMLDENLGTERIIVVSTAQPFSALEQQLNRSATPTEALLASAAQKDSAMPAPTVDPTRHVAFARGVAGIRPAKGALPPLTGAPASGQPAVVQALEGTAGVLAKEFWFQHVAPKGSANTRQP